MASGESYSTLSMQAKMDIQTVGTECGTECGTAIYVCMYVFKSEPERLKYAMHETLQNIPPDTSLLK